MPRPPITMRACFVPVLSIVLALQGAFEASPERLSPALNEISASPASQNVESDAMTLSQIVSGKDSKARRFDTRVSAGTSDARVTSDGNEKHLVVRGSHMPREATTLAHVVKHGGKGCLARRPEAQALPDFIGSEGKPGHPWEYDSKYRYQMPRVTTSPHRHGLRLSTSPSRTVTVRGLPGSRPAKVQATAIPPTARPASAKTPNTGRPMSHITSHVASIGHGVNKKIGHGGGDKIGHGRGNKIGKGAKINHNEAYGDDEHKLTRQSEAQTLPTIPRPSY